MFFTYFDQFFRHKNLKRIQTKSDFLHFLSVNEDAKVTFFDKILPFYDGNWPS